MKRSLVVGLIAIGAYVSVLSAAQSSPYPPRAGGSGSEPTRGSGIGAGTSFKPRYALATYDGSNYVFVLTPQQLAWKDTVLAKPPYLTVTIVAGSPLVVGAPT